MILNLFYLFLASTTNLVNNDFIKLSTVTNPPSTPISTTNEAVPSPSQPPTPKIEIPTVSETPSPTVKAEPVSNRIPIENKPTETPNPNVIADTSEKNSDDSKTPSRVIVNRNVVIAEPNRKVVQGTLNRVVVSSATINSSKKTTNDSDSDLDDLFEQENDTTKSK
jgi:hypothetical protein